MKNLLNIFGRGHAGRGHKPDIEALSAYLDRRLTPNESAAVEAHAAACDACQTQLAGLQEVRASLRAMPQAEAPRSFRVRQADVEAASKRIAAPAASPWTRALPAFGGLAAAVFVFAIVVDVRGSDTNSDQTSAMRTTSELEASMPAGGIAADAGTDTTRDNAYDRGDAPAPLAPEDGAGAEAGGPGGSGEGAATSAPPQGDMEPNAGAEGSPDVEAARDLTTSSDNGGWPLARYIAIVAAISALAALGAWLGFTFERRLS